MRWLSRDFGHTLGTIIGASGFARVSGSPSDRNLIDLYADAGLDFIGVFDARPNDKFGFAGAYAHVSKRAQALDADFQARRGTAWPARSFEAMYTMAYQYEVVSGW